MTEDFDLDPDEVFDELNERVEIEDGEDSIKDVRMRDVPLLVYKSGMVPMNEWDTREFPDSLQVIGQMNKTSLALFEEANRLEKYGVKAADWMGVELPESKTMGEPRNRMEAVWKATGMVLRRMHVLRRRVVTVMKHVEESPLIKAAYGTPELGLLLGYYGEVYSLVVEQKLLRMNLEGMFTELLMCLTEDEDDTELSDKLDEFRMKEYVEIRQKMKRTRLKERYTRV